MLGRRGIGSRALFTDTATPTSEDPHQEWSKRVPVLSGGSGLIWLDKPNPEAEYLLLSGIKDGQLRCSLLPPDHMENYNFPLLLGNP